MVCRCFPCSKCKRTFTSSRGVPDLTLTSGIDPGVYKSESFAGQDIFRCLALLPCASACWHLADPLSHCLFLLGDYACLQLISELYQFAEIPLSASFMSVAGGKGSSQLDFQVSELHCKHESVTYFPSSQGCGIQHASSLSGLACATLAGSGFMLVQAYNLSFYAGADEELKLAMEFLTPAFGEVSMPQ